MISNIRFEFGENWTRFLSVLNEDRILEAEDSLIEMLGIDELKYKTFLDIGSGSGLFSLAATRLGAKVHSFDYDPQSVACTMELRRIYFNGNVDWFVEEGNILNDEYISQLGQYDVVYSWGVLHHTGEMWKALAYVDRLVKKGGCLFISIYNDQGRASKRWTVIKRIYNKLPNGIKFIILWPLFIRLWLPSIIRDFLRFKPFYTWKTYSKNGRGMSPWHDVVDWVGGYPFEVAKPEEIFEFFRERGFCLRKLKTCAGGIGCNEYVFKRIE